MAAAIAVAYDEKDIKTVIREALKEIPEDCEYARAVRAVAIFHEECPEDWRECFQYVHDNWGYDRYPGNCHIIPNAAVMALAMYYGQGDFSRTIEIATMCGWDTDCNAGNVGCIVGTMVGLEGIDREKWLAPMNDGFAASNAIGCLGFIDAPWYRPVSGRHYPAAGGGTRRTSPRGRGCTTLNCLVPPTALNPKPPAWRTPAAA